MCSFHGEMQNVCKILVRNLKVPDYFEDVCVIWRTVLSDIKENGCEFEVGVTVQWLIL